MAVGYTDYTGTDGATLRLQTSRTDRISAGVSTETRYVRSTTNKFTITSATVDQGGLNLRTCTMFDAAGNLASLSDPRQGTCP